MKWIYGLVLFFSLFLAACDSSPLASMEDDMEEIADEAAYRERESKRSAENEKARHSSSSSRYSSSSSVQYCYDTYGYYVVCGSSSSTRYSSSSREYYSSSSYSSSSLSYDYLLEPKIMRLTLTYYEQIKAGLDGTSSYTDGDPRIKFKIHVLDSYGDTLKTFTSKTLLSKDDTGYWTGSQSDVFDIPAGVKRIWVCPIVTDSDVMFDDDYSSNYCYGRNLVGLLEPKEIVYQSDYENKNCNLDWNWYLY
ncbi:MAG: hypothetical protein HUK21_12320 [Fibrobacteraceae bacterium]|nr:hypothetical protein [Fibrobacteraceae bacterium]